MSVALKISENIMIIKSRAIQTNLNFGKHSTPMYDCVSTFQKFEEDMDMKNAANTLLNLDSSCLDIRTGKMD